MGNAQSALRGIAKQSGLSALVVALLIPGLSGCNATWEPPTQPPRYGIGPLVIGKPRGEIEQAPNELDCRPESEDAAICEYRGRPFARDFFGSKVQGIVQVLMYRPFTNVDGLVFDVDQSPSQRELETGWNLNHQCLDDFDIDRALDADASLRATVNTLNELGIRPGLEGFICVDDQDVLVTITKSLDWKVRIILAKPFIASMVRSVLAGVERYETLTREMNGSPP